MVSRLTQRPRPPDGGFRGLSECSFWSLLPRIQTVSIPFFSHKCSNGRRNTLQVILILSPKKSPVKQARCDVVFTGRCNPNRPGNVGQGPCNIWQAVARSLKPPNHLCGEQIEGRGGTITAPDDSRDSAEHTLPRASSGTLPSRKVTFGKSLICDIFLESSAIGYINGI